MSTQTTSPPTLPIEAADVTEREMLRLCGLQSLRQLRSGISSGRIPPPDLVPTRNLLRWRRSTVERWLNSNSKPTEEGVSDAS